ncbi:site-specific integrase [Vibrio sp. S9_S30]|uniref:site-specific integrase n=1 Tax=Vibrio sp. S9_S30 TaxID=2720226 RepID=UPI0016816C8B|nr:site-specific integrase [Vibrio sp. S9_S30]MBD1559583.1 site-specific integrase [Vibrio sp. S9_S30]
MALPPVVDNPQWLFKVTKQQDSNPEMSLCLLGFFLGTGLKTIEICRIQVGDLISKSGELNRKFLVRGEAERDVFLVNEKLKTLIRDYIEVRAPDGNHPDNYCGFNPAEPFFKRKRFGEFKILAKQSGSGKRSFYCPSLNNHIKKLLNHSGIENPSIESGRRTFALKLKGRVDVPSIHKALGNKDINTTKKLLHTDPITMRELAELAF